MNKILDNSQMKFVYVVRMIITVLALCSLVCSVWLIIIAKNFQDQSILFPLIFGICCLFNVYKLNRTLKTNNLEITPFQVKCHLLMFGRGALISLTYFFIVMHDVKQAIGFATFTLLAIGVEILIRRMEVKRVKKL